MGSYLWPHLPTVQGFYIIELWGKDDKTVGKKSPTQFVNRKVVSRRMLASEAGLLVVVSWPLLRNYAEP